MGRLVLQQSSAIMKNTTDPGSSNDTKVTSTKIENKSSKTKGKRKLKLINHLPVKKRLSKSEFDMKHSEDKVLASHQFGNQSNNIKPSETQSEKALHDWNSKLNLKNSGKDIVLNEKSWLTDSHINAAIWLW